MKTLTLITFSFLLSLTSLSQVLVIQVNKIQSFVGFETQSLNDVMSNPFEYGEIENKDCRYIIDFNTNTVEFYSNGELISDGEITLESENGFQLVNFLGDGFNYGLIINPNLMNESVTLFQYYDDKVEYMKFIDFEIMKSL